jgi:hypothetical protein
VVCRLEWRVISQAVMISDAEWQRVDTRTKSSVRYPAWYPWFLRGDEGLPDGGRDPGMGDHLPIDPPTTHGGPRRFTSSGAIGSG